MQDAVAGRFDLTAGDGRVIREADELRPGDEVHRGEHAFESGFVLGCLLAGRFLSPVTLASAIRRNFGGSIAKIQLAEDAPRRCFHYAGSVCPGQAIVTLPHPEVFTPRVARVLAEPVSAC